jgi:hypothetical protein
MAESGERLAAALGIAVVTNAQLGRERDEGLDTGTLFNWGVRSPKAYCLFNHAAAMASNKLLTFDRLNRYRSEECPEGVPHVPWFTERSLRPPDSVIFCRTRGGFDGSGIRIIEPNEELPPADLYTVYMPNLYEYSVHVVLGRIVGIHRKVLLHKSKWPEGARLIDPANPMRCRAGKAFGWQIKDVPLDKDRAASTVSLSEIALNAIKALGLDYGRVDVIYNATKNDLLVVEVNSAPELLGERLEAWAAAIRETIER